MVFTLILIAVLVLLVADTIYARARIALRRRAATQRPRPAWDLTSPSDRGWHTLAARDRNDSFGNDVGRLFGGRTSAQSRRPAPQRLERH
jgi:hypothetical protein